MSKKQKFARRRNYFIWRIKGMYIDITSLSPKEKESALIINHHLKKLKDNFTEESIKLGLNAKYRCFCGRDKGSKDAKYCKICIKEFGL